MTTPQPPSCPECGHYAHERRRCDYPITETIRDDIGIYCRPSGRVETILVDTCSCSSCPHQSVMSQDSNPPILWCQDCRTTLR